MRALGLNPEWKACDGLPREATPQKISQAIQATAHETQPASSEVFAVCLLKLAKFGRAFGFLETKASDITGFYREALADVPADLLELAVDGTIRSWKWNRMPSPADLRQSISSELAQRTAAKNALERALWKAKMEAKAPPAPKIKLTPEQQAQVDRYIARRRRREAPEEMTAEQAEAELAANKAKWVDEFVNG